MFLPDFFKKDDKQVKDKCPVCNGQLGKAYIKLERVYYCEECGWLVEFHPFEAKGRMIKKKKGDKFEKPYIPYQEDGWMVPDLPEDPDLPPTGPRTPPWWV